MAKPRADKKSQSGKFIARALELECDEDEDRFNATLKRLATRSSKKNKDTED